MGGDEKKTQQRLVVIGHGMVGHRFLEEMISKDTAKQFKLTVFGDETRPAYNRMLLTKYFETRDADDLTLLSEPTWMDDNNIETFIGEQVANVDREKKSVLTTSGREVPYDKVIIATGATPFVPPINGVAIKSQRKPGVFVYRTIEDLQDMIKYSENASAAAVIGGGLLGLEAAKAAKDLGLHVTILDKNPWLMSRQLDETAAKYLQEKVEALGLDVILSANTEEIVGADSVQGIRYNGDQMLNVQMVVICTGIAARDEVARSSGIAIGPRGGILVDDKLQTSDENIFAIGECALHHGMIYGLVAPGYEMASVVASNLTRADAEEKKEAEREFTEASMSTKLKLLGVNVASFGEYFADQTVKGARSICFQDPFTGVYKKLLFSGDGKRLLGGILVGDTSEYAKFLTLCTKDEDLKMPPNELLLGSSSGSGSAGGGAEELSDDTQVCSCNNVTKGQISTAIREKCLDSVDAVKKCTKAGASCGGCIPMVGDILSAELKAMGATKKSGLCEHFAYSRQELVMIIQATQTRTFSDLLKSHGKPDSSGCEICKPTIASILASLWNDLILEQPTLQDSNDRFLANLQRSGQYSIVPRIPGGEITPEKLIVIGEVAKKYDLYTKITGGQRIDLFGAEVHQLPEIWEALVNAGFESGHAYGKSLRTVKTCVGSTWCRYGQQDSVGFGIQLENRYKGMRSPHKVKGAVSGCIRECAEAQSKDFGLIATDKGYNLYLCGNGGSKPKHAILFATDISEETVVKYLDRFFMFYIRTADKLQRTARWIEKLEGGIDYLKEVIIEDCLGIAESLEKDMEHVVGTYQCEWTDVVNNPERRKLFKQFVNTDKTQDIVENITERSQRFPARFPKNARLPSPDSISRHPALSSSSATDSDGVYSWVKAGKALDFPDEGGAAVLFGDVQLAVFHFASRRKWYATQNMCPHTHAFVMSQGLTGDQQGEAKVACPVHKRTFSLEDGRCLSEDDSELHLEVFEVKVDLDGCVYIRLPNRQVLDDVLSTEKHKLKAKYANPLLILTSKNLATLDGSTTEEGDDGEEETASCGSSGGGCGSRKELDW